MSRYGIYRFLFIMNTFFLGLDMFRVASGVDVGFNVFAAVLSAFAAYVCYVGSERIKQSENKDDGQSPTTKQ